MFKQFSVLIALTLCLALSTAATSVSNDAVDCPQICPLIYRPVCATDGKIYKEFASECDLKSSNCRRERNAAKPYALTDIAWCTSELVDNLKEKLGNLNIEQAACLKACPMIYQPICVTNGKYRALLSNECLLDMFNCALQAEGATEMIRKLSDNEC